MYVMNLNTGLIYGTIQKGQVDQAAEALIKEAKRREKDPEAESYVFTEGDLEEFTGPQLVRIFNANREETMDPVKKFSDKRTAVKRVKQVLPDYGYKPEVNQTEARQVSNDRRRPQRYYDNARIKVLVDENPKRPGKLTHDQFDLYFRCDTVGEFVQKGGLMAYLYYDVCKGFVKVEGGRKS